MNSRGKVPRARQFATRRRAHAKRRAAIDRIDRWTRERRTRERERERARARTIDDSKRTIHRLRATDATRGGARGANDAVRRGVDDRRDDGESESRGSGARGADGGERMARGRRERDGWRGRREAKGRERAVVALGTSADAGIWGRATDARARDDARAADGAAGAAGAAGTAAAAERRGAGERRTFAGERRGAEAAERGTEAAG